MTGFEKIKLLEHCTASEPHHNTRSQTQNGDGTHNTLLSSRFIPLKMHQVRIFHPKIKPLSTFNKQLANFKFCEGPAKLTKRNLCYIDLHFLTNWNHTFETCCKQVNKGEEVKQFKQHFRDYFRLDFHTYCFSLPQFLIKTMILSKIFGVWENVCFIAEDNKSGNK